MAAALDAGARIVNDVSALTHDAESTALVARRGASVVLMHMRGEPRTMQCDPVYDSPLIEVLEFLEARVEACIAAGIPRGDIAIDPGIGFGKLLPHNLELIAGIAAFHTLGCGIVLGVSRKSMLARLSRGEPPKARLPGSLAAACSRSSRVFKSYGFTMSPKPARRSPCGVLSRRVEADPPGR